MPSILLFGVTGLVGSHLVLALKSNYPSIPVTAYLRNKDIDDYLKKTGGVHRIVHGSYHEHEKISALAKEHDIVINVGSSWDVGLSEAIVAGQKQRPESSKTTLIHMSGTGNFVDKRWTDGSHHAETKVWSDDSVEDMKKINPEMLNGGPDTVVLTAGQTGKIATYMVIPSGLYGLSTGPIRALGVVQLIMYEKAKELGFIPYVGEGTAIFNNLHVKDVVEFMLKTLDFALRDDQPQGSVYERCYIIGGENMPWKVAADAFAKYYQSKGIIESPVAKSVPYEQAGVGELKMLMASDMRFIGPRAERLGHKIKEPGLVDFLAGEPDIIP